MCNNVHFNYYLINPLDLLKRYLLFVYWCSLPAIPIYFFNHFFWPCEFGSKARWLFFSTAPTLCWPKKDKRSMGKPQKPTIQDSSIQMRCGETWSICLDSVQLAISERKSPSRDRVPESRRAAVVSAFLGQARALGQTTWLPQRSCPSGPLSN